MDTVIYSPYQGGRFRISSPYGWRVLSGMREWHRGLDLVGADGDTAVCSVIAGRVRMSRIVYDHNNLTWQWGNYVSIEGEDGKTIFYCHLASRAVETGQVVKAGQYIGEQGHTGYSFGDHLHFEVRQGANDINAAGYLGVQNVAGNRYYSLPTPKPDYIAMVCREIGLEEQTRQYLAEYKYADDLGRKLWQWKHGG